MARGVWVFDPHQGGKKIPPSVQESIRKRVIDYTEKHYFGKYSRLDVRFKGQFCYIDLYKEPDEPDKKFLKATGETREQYFERQRSFPTHLCRLRYFSNEDKMSYSFFSYAKMRYEPCYLDNGFFEGTPEEAVKASEMYILD